MHDIHAIYNYRFEVTLMLRSLRLLAVATLAGTSLTCSSPVEEEGGQTALPERVAPEVVEEATKVPESTFPLEDSPSLSKIEILDELIKNLEDPPQKINENPPAKPPPRSDPEVDSPANGSPNDQHSDRAMASEVTKEALVEERPTSQEETAVPADMVSRDYGNDCLRSGCHLQLSKTPWVHGPISVIECNPCHILEGEPAEHKFRLARPKEELCQTCHLHEVVREVVHEPYAELKCLECHDPHGGENRNLLILGSVAQLCGKCHEFQKPTEEMYMHDPFTAGECTVCHVSHQSSHAHLLSLPNKDLCLGCHSETEKQMNESAFLHGPAAVDCSACHSSHGTTYPFLLHQNSRVLCLGCHDTVAEKIASDTFVHGAFEEEEGCVQCHTPHASQYQSQLIAVTSELCLGCHNREIVKKGGKKAVANIAKELKSAKFKHGPVQTGDCQSCHFSHSSSFAKLLQDFYPTEFYKEFKVSNYAHCFHCHEDTLVLAEQTTSMTNFRQGDRNLHYLHVNREKGRTCRVCHEIHGGNFPKLIRKEVLFGSIRWPLPIGFQKTETGGTCSPGCHKSASYDNVGLADRGEIPKILKE